MQVQVQVTSRLPYNKLEMSSVHSLVFKCLYQPPFDAIHLLRSVVADGGGLTSVILLQKGVNSC